MAQNMPLVGSCTCFAATQQAPCAKKKAKAAKADASEEVVPQTLADKIKEKLEEMLKKSGVARTASIPLGGLEYAENLGNAIKKHADEVEKLYTDSTATIKGSPSDKELTKLMKRIEEKSQATAKLQATWVEFRTAEVELLVVASHLMPC